MTTKVKPPLSREYRRRQLRASDLRRLADAMDEHASVNVLMSIEQLARAAGEQQVPEGRCSECLKQIVGGSWGLDGRCFDCREVPT